MPSVSTMRRAILILALLVAGGAIGAGKLAGGGDHTATVVRVVDGDTIVVRLAGRPERVRYIGIDTPESMKPGTPVECFAKAAAAENRRLVAGRRVRLVHDAEERDRYGRLLAYVYRDRDGLFVNGELVRLGYARTLTISPNVAQAARLARLAAGARRAGRGLWRRC